MKTRRVAFLSLMLSVLALGGRASATFQPSYASYNAMSVGSDGQTVYSTVTLQGTTTGDCTYTGRYGTGTIPGCTGALHTPKIYNQVGTAGGWTTGQTVTMWTYINFQNTTNFVATPGVTYEVHTRSEIFCTGVGRVFFGDFWDLNWLLASTLSRYTGTASNCHTLPLTGITICDFSTTSNCTPGTSPPNFNPTIITDTTPALAGWLSAALCFRVLSSEPWDCGTIPAWALKTTQTTPGVCTKVP